MNQEETRLVRAEKEKAEDTLKLRREKDLSMIARFASSECQLFIDADTVSITKSSVMLLVPEDQSSADLMYTLQMLQVQGKRFKDIEALREGAKEAAFQYSKRKSRVFELLNLPEIRFWRHAPKPVQV